MQIEVFGLSHDKFEKLLIQNEQNNSTELPSYSFHNICKNICKTNKNSPDIFSYKFPNDFPWYSFQTTAQNRHSQIFELQKACMENGKTQ